MPAVTFPSRAGKFARLRCCSAGSFSCRLQRERFGGTPINLANLDLMMDAILRGANTPAAHTSKSRTGCISTVAVEVARLQCREWRVARVPNEVLSTRRRHARASRV
jgi:hypothetical protein